MVTASFRVLTSPSALDYIQPSPNYSGIVSSSVRYDIDLRIFVFERNGVGHDVRIDVERMSLCNHRITRYTRHRLHKLHKVGDPLVAMVHRVRVARI